MAIEKENNSSALLATAVVMIEVEGRISQPTRALCDTGAQANIIDNKLVQQMGCRGTRNIQANIKVATAVLSDYEPEEKLDLILKQFWEIETVPTTRIRTFEQDKCEEIFMQTCKRLPNGRFQVDIPLKSSINQLGSTRETALRRVHNLEKRLQRDPELREMYISTMKNLMDADQMRLVNRPPSAFCYHIPHHPVLKKFRIVYDATCKSDKGVSLNDVQLIGERLQDDTVTLMMRFRCHAVAISADIRKMYLQVRVNPNQWDLQRIFWRSSTTDPIREYWLTTVTFGMASAPHCAVRAMVQGAREARGQFPKGALAVEHDFTWTIV